MEVFLWEENPSVQLKQHLFVVLVLFCCLKIFLDDFEDRVTNLISVVSVGAKRGKNLHALTIFTGRRVKHEVPFCDVTETDLNHVAVTDEYSLGYTVFPVYGAEVRVYDDRLCEAIKVLSERQRNIVLMFYFLEMYGGITKWNVYKNVHDFQLSIQ